MKQASILALLVICFGSLFSITQSVSTISGGSCATGFNPPGCSLTVNGPGGSALTMTASGISVTNTVLANNVSFGGWWSGSQNTNGGVAFGTSHMIVWANAATNVQTGSVSGAGDLGLARSAAGVLELDNGTVGTTTNAAIKLAGDISVGTKFTITGCGAGTTVGGATAGTMVSGTTGACTIVITLAGATGLAAPNGWTCHADDRTTPANLISQSASTTTTCTITGTTVTNDVLSFMALGY